MTVTTERARRAGGLATALALALVQGTIAQSPPAAAIEALSFGATGYDFPAVSADGRHVAFLTDARLDPRDANLSFDIYVRDRVRGTTALVSVTRDGVVGNGSSQRPSISADGRFVAFASSASNLVPDDVNNADDIFVLDRDSGEDGVFDEPDGTIVTRVSLDTDGIEANCTSARPSISADGRYVAFDSCVTNWAVVSGKTLAVHDIFVHDRERFVTEWVNPSTQNSPNRFNNHHSGDASISSDGRFVAFASQATTQPQTLGHFGSSQIYVRDTCRGAPGACQEATEWASPQAHVDSEPSDAFKPSISADGRHVAYESRSTVLVPGDTNAVTDIFVFNRQTQAATRVNVSSAGSQAVTTQPSTCSGSLHASISGNGRFVAFESCANNLVADDTVPPNYQDIFVHDRDPDGNGAFDEAGSIATRLITRNPAGITADSSSLYPTISTDGRVIVFSSFSRDITPAASPIGVYAWTAGNQVPIADAGSDQTVGATGPDGATVTLDASASSDPDGDPLTFTWTGSFGTLTGVSVSPTLGAGTHTVTLTVDDGRGGTATDTVAIDVTTTGEIADLSLAVSASPLSVDIGDDIRYAIRVANDDVAEATGVVVRVALPAHVSFVDAHLPPGACAAPPAGTAGMVACTVGAVAPGTFAAFTLGLAPQMAGPLTLTITVDAAESDPTPANNRADVTVTVIPAPAVISIVESIGVSDAVALTPSALLDVTESITVSDSPGVLPAALLAINESIVVTDTPAVLPAAMLTVTETVTVVDAAEVAPPVNTPRGVGVAVTPIDAATGGTPVRLTFATVTEPGDTVVVIGPGPPPPPGVTGGRPPRFYDLSTTAAFTGNVEVCVSYAGTTFDSIPSLWHFENGGWVDITVRHDRASQEICGGARSLSPFALFAPINQAPSVVVPAELVAEATGAAGAAVMFSATASDPEDGPITPICVPASGSQFGLGVTSVTCSVADSAGAGAEGRFSVTVPRHHAAGADCPTSGQRDGNQRRRRGCGLRHLGRGSGRRSGRANLRTGFGRHLPHWQYHGPLHRDRCARQRRATQLHSQRHRRHSVDHRQAGRQRS